MLLRNAALGPREEGSDFHGLPQPAEKRAETTSRGPNWDRLHILFALMNQDIPVFSNIMSEPQLVEAYLALGCQALH